MNRKHILIVDDDERIRDLLGKYLQKNGFVVTAVPDAQIARDALDMFHFDLIILDIMLPKESGIEFAKKLRQSSSIAIMMLSAMGSALNRISGLEAGADDYLPKPFEPKELLLRIDRLIKRAEHFNTAPDSTKNNEIKLGNILYNQTNGTVLKHNELIPLSDRENALLSLLIQKKGYVVSRDALADELKINPRSVDVQINRLRGKLEQDSEKPHLLRTIHGKGYILT